MNSLKLIFRQWAKSPGFVALALITLALGIGLNTSMFSLMNLLILQPLPYPDRDHLARIYRTTPQSNTAEISAPDFQQMERDLKPNARVAAFRMWGYTLSQPNHPSTNLNAIRVSAGFLPALGLRPELGRYFNADEEGADNHVVILSHATWQAQFGGDPDIIGKTVKIDGAPTVIVGVMPQEFSSIFLWGPADAVRPMALTPAEAVDHGATEYRVLARVNSDLTLEQFDRRLSEYAAATADQRAPANRSDGLRAISLQSSARSANTRGLCTFLLGLSASVLLIACANLANMQLAQALGRSHEFAIRSALGASRGRIIRSLLLENLVLVSVGGLLGLVVALWTNDWISTRLSANGYVTFTLSIDFTVIAFTFLLTVVTGVLFGLIPGWMMTRIRVNDSLKAGARSVTGDRAQHRLRHVLIIVQLALALTLLAGAGAFTRAFARMLRSETGWEEHGLLQAVLNLPAARYPDTERTYAFYTRLQEQLGALPGVESVSVAWTLPVFQFLTHRSFVVEGRPPPPAGHEPVIDIDGVTPSFLGNLGIRLQSGRNFTEADGPKAPRVVIINESLARALFPGDNPIGHHLVPTDPTDRRSLEIVGVIPDLKFAVNVVAHTTSYQMLCPLAQETWNYVTVSVRSSSPASLVEPVRKTLAGIDPDLAVQQYGTLDSIVHTALGSFSMVSSILLAFAALGLFLSTLGLYGVIARLVSARTAEIGIRMALGAQSFDVFWLICRTGLILAAIGSAIGILGGFGVIQGIAHALPYMPVEAPWTLVGMCGLLIAVAAVATWIPARRATRVNPVVALRSE
ncbi:MAG TPA: ABC transporter permease [Candidatus Didemnitutus sp.]|nr:ABC transporter permease [Candidatus Didemnitutus sp.]